MVPSEKMSFPPVPTHDLEEETKFPIWRERERERERERDTHLTATVKL
jgi:hypothetical protein